MNISPTQSLYTTQNKPKKNVSFGCRVMAFAKANGVTSEDDQLRLSCLQKDDESLKSQSKIRSNKYGDAFGPLGYEDLFGMRKRGNMSGWGIIGLKKDAPAPIKDKGTLPAYMDPHFNDAVSNIVAEKPEIILAHVRAASKECNQVNMNNVHPFTYKNWGFMHNGFVPGALSQPIQDKIKNKYANILGEAPKGTTDSESSFYYFMGKLQEKYNTTDSKQIGLENVKATFAETISDLVENSNKGLKKLDGNVLGVKGEMSTSPSCNFIASDGENLLAFHRGPDLFLGMKTLKNGENEYIISSEAITPDDQVVQWLSIPQNHMMVLSKDKKGNFTPELEPLAKYTKKEIL